MAEKTEAPAEIRFTKEDILSSRTYAGNRDLLMAILDKEKTYTKSEIETAIEKYQKGKVS